MKVNLGCGGIFCTSKDWQNFDFSPADVGIRYANLLARLPLGDSSCSVVYSSHFFEHIPRAHIPKFLQECNRVLKPGGVLRLVMPDTEEICEEYLRQIHQGDGMKSELLILQLVDQYVRNTPGGELGRFYNMIGSMPDNEEILDYVKKRNGHIVEIFSNRRFMDRLREKVSSVGSFVEVANLVRGALNAIHIRGVCAVLPRSFRDQNVSFAAVGEKHQWAWDFTQLKHCLVAADFLNVRRVSHNQSQIIDFPFFPLDTDRSGMPRKGAESMFVEAQKPDLNT